MKQIKARIEQAASFLVTTHIHPDGDGLGSAMALHGYLKRTGKKSCVMTQGERPAKFALVDPLAEIQTWDPACGLPQVDLVLVVDTSDLKMLGPMESLLQASKTPVIFVDHHVPDSHLAEGHENHLIDEKFGSTGELIYHFLQFLKADIDEPMALALYVAILTDTGSFRHQRTTADSHLIVSELLKKGVSPEKVYQTIYARESLAKIRLLGHVLERAQLSENGLVAWLEIPQKALSDFGATVEDTESFVNHITLLQGVQIGAMFREDPLGKIKVSLRGNGDVPVVQVAQQFGGGGHRHAAGMRVTGSLSSVVRQVIAACQTSLHTRLPTSL